MQKQPRTSFVNTVRPEPVEGQTRSSDDSSCFDKLSMNDFDIYAVAFGFFNVKSIPALFVYEEKV